MGAAAGTKERWGEEQLTDSFENGCMFLVNHIFGPQLSNIFRPTHTLKPRGISNSNNFWMSEPCHSFLKSLFLRERYYMRLSKGKICFYKLQSGRENIEDVLRKQNKPEK